MSKQKTKVERKQSNTGDNSGLDNGKCARERRLPEDMKENDTQGVN